MLFLDLVDEPYEVGQMVEINSQKSDSESAPKQCLNEASKKAQENDLLYGAPDLDFLLSKENQEIAQYLPEDAHDSQKAPQNEHEEIKYPITDQISPIKSVKWRAFDPDTSQEMVQSQH